MNRRRWLFVIFGGLVLVVITSLWFQHEYDSLPSAYARLTPGMSKNDVLRDFGKPGQITKCLYAPSWDGAPVDAKSPKCVQEFSYSSHVRIGLWVIGFDQSDKVVTKHYLSSP
jgi:hypothetical protein